MDVDRFEYLVQRAVSKLPLEIHRGLDNVAIMVAEWPSHGHLARARVRSRHDLLGLYEGVPLVNRDSGYTMVLPDRITIFHRPIELSCATDDEIENQVRRVVIHEIGHHLGFSEEQLAELERQL